MEPRQGPATSTVEGADLRAELLARLGLPADATASDVAAAHRAAVALLDHVPADQRAWAESQLADVEAITSLLDDLSPTETVSARPAPAPDARVAARSVRRPPWVVWAVAAVVLVAGAAFGLHVMNAAAVPGISGAPDTSTTGTAPALDQAKVAALMQKITTNPKDTAALNQLATLYFQAGDYKNSAVFSQKVVALDPKDDTAWVALGAAQFNQVDQKSALASWLRAVAVNPKNAEAHYDLGFLYLSGDKPDVAKAKAEWQTVIAIDPKSQLATTVQTHLSSLASASASPSASTGS